ncbi:glutaredoxin-like protein NrdH [Vibrio tritonius]|uniref:Glutaredoxin-like protein NrdH n=1 Tax=Vibrio tritonius TaxID=1435069 RepID=A0ABS7YL03_9VIBR|nr:glutaredoxin-like protein NrdH [Vibrio tritonius]MCA2016365.1 glutaredoxin-like protein NrdH [Vibrio tritonius]
MEIIVYSKSQCVQCAATVKSLEAKGIKHQVIDLTENHEAMKTVQAMGYRQVPVVVAGSEHWCGFRPDMISRIFS